MIGNPGVKHHTWTMLIAALLLLPSAWFLASFPDLPRFGQLHDDTLYLVSAKSLAAGEGYRIESLPQAPPQTKYPPLYPMLLSIAWRIAPEFPGTLAWAAWLSWLALPAILAHMGGLYSRMGFGSGRTWALMSLFALNPYVMLFSSQLLSELWFLALVLASFAAIERARDSRSVKWAVAAGGFAGLAYLTRSAGAALLAAGVVYLWIGKRRRLAAWFAATAAPFVAAWTAWVRTHQLPTSDPELLYYLDYFRYQLYAVSWADLPVVLWKNADGLLAGLGGLVLPKMTGSLFEKILAQVLAVAMISGVVRLLRRKSGTLFGWFALFSSLLLLVWHFPPNERFMLPLFPLALAGLLVEAEHFAGLLRASRRHKDRSQRIAGAVMMGVAGIFALCLAGVQFYVAGFYLPQDARARRAEVAERRTSYDWLAANTPSDAGVLSSDDGLVYLYTGRKAMRRPVPPFLWYREDRGGTVAWLGEPEDYARGHGLSYLDFAGIDVSLGIGEEDGAAIEKKLASSDELASVLKRGKVTLFAIRPPDPASAALHTAPLPPAQ